MTRLKSGSIQTVVGFKQERRHSLPTFSVNAGEIVIFPTPTFTFYHMMSVFCWLRGSALSLGNLFARSRKFSGSKLRSGGKNRIQPRRQEEESSYCTVNTKLSNGILSVPRPSFGRRNSLFSSLTRRLCIPGM